MRTFFSSQKASALLLVLLLSGLTTAVAALTSGTWVRSDDFDACTSPQICYDWDDGYGTLKCCLNPPEEDEFENAGDITLCQSLRYVVKP